MSTDDPNYLSPTVAAAAREQCEKLLQSQTDVYWRAVDVWNAISEGMYEDKAPGRLYVLWAELTDLWELDIRPEAEVEGFMREAAQDLLDVGDDSEKLGSYLNRWEGRLASVEPHPSTPPANRNWYLGTNAEDAAGENPSWLERLWRRLVEAKRD